MNNLLYTPVSKTEAFNLAPGLEPNLFKGFQQKCDGTIIAYTENLTVRSDRARYSWDDFTQTLWVSYWIEDCNPFTGKLERIIPCVAQASKDTPFYVIHHDPVELRGLNPEMLSIDGEYRGAIYGKTQNYDVFLFSFEDPTSEPYKAVQRNIPGNVLLNNTFIKTVNYPDRTFTVIRTSDDNIIVETSDGIITIPRAPSEMLKASDDLSGWININRFGNVISVPKLDRIDTRFLLYYEVASETWYRFNSFSTSYCFNIMMESPSFEYFYNTVEKHVNYLTDDGTEVEALVQFYKKDDDNNTLFTVDMDGNSQRVGVQDVSL